MQPLANTRTTNQRSGRRVAVMLRAIKLVTPDGDYLCILRNVSPGGIKLRLFHALPEARPLEIELASGARHAVEPVWQSGDSAGFRFVGGPLPLAELLSEGGPFPRRGVRLRAELPIVIEGPGGPVPGRLNNISLDGARIDSSRQFPLSSRLRILSPLLPEIHGKVRWRRGDAHGLAFEQHFGLDELARLLAPEAIDLPQSSANSVAR